jgi:hypothetical protein
MSTPRHLLAATAGLLLLSACAHAATVLLQDDFRAYSRGSDASPMWLADTGEWKVTADGLLGTDCDAFFTAAGARSGRKEWRDYTLSVKLKVVSRATPTPWASTTAAPTSTKHPRAEARATATRLRAARPPSRTTRGTT